MAGFGERIKALREGKGWKQDDLATAAQVSRDTIFRAERGENVRVNSLFQIAAALGVPVGALFAGRGKAAVARRDRDAARLLGSLTPEQHEFVVRLMRTMTNEEAESTAGE